VLPVKVLPLTVAGLLSLLARPPPKQADIKRR
jgi:hypothetical protein